MSCLNLLCQNEDHSCATIRHNLPGDILSRIFFFAELYDFFDVRKIFNSRHIFYVMNTEPSMYHHIFISAVKQSQLQIVREIMPRIEFQYHEEYTNAIIDVADRRDWRLLKTIFNHAPFRVVMEEEYRFVSKMMDYLLDRNQLNSDVGRDITEHIIHLIPSIFIEGDILTTPFIVHYKRHVFADVLNLILDAFPGKKVSIYIVELLFECKRIRELKRIVAEGRILDSRHGYFYIMVVCPSYGDDELMELTLNFPTTRHYVKRAIHIARNTNWSNFLYKRVLPNYP